MPLNEIELHGRIRMLARLRSMQQERARRQAILSAFGDRKGGDPPAVPALDRTAILLFGPAGGSQVQVMSALGGAATAAYAETAELALERLRRADIDVVVITARHDLDAIAAFCRTVREDRRFADLPILWLAEAALLSEADEPVGWGASDVLLQPVHPELLRLRLKSWVRLQRLRRELQGGLGAAGGAVAIDRLTGLYGHSFLHCYLDRQIGSPRPPGRTLAVITVAPVAMDRINRTIGYPGGDRFLIELGKTISQSCRSEDLTCRYGGDRFCVVLGSIRGKDGRAVARRIGRALEQADWNGADLAPREPMFHLGFAERQAEDDAISLLRRAFQARLNAGLRAVS
jgi:diguanylate cyclase (GGDEF)-like protein